MTRKTGPSLLVLTAADVDAVLGSLDPERALASQSAVFKAFSASHAAATAAAAPAAGPPAIQAPLRTTLASPESTMLFMPSRVAPQTACKIVSVPRAGSDGLPASTVVMDEASGRVRAIVNARKLTALRNAAGSALSVRAAGAATTHLVVFGTGAQAHAHASLFLRLFPFETCTLISRTATTRAAQLAAALSAAFPGKIVAGAAADPAFNLKQAVHNADVVLTLTPSTVALFDSVDVRAGAHVVCVGSYRPDMREIQDDLVRRAGVVCVDSRAACAREAGELISAGVTESGMVELGELLAATEWDKTGGDVTLFKSVRQLSRWTSRRQLTGQVGIGLQDVAIASLVLDEAERIGLGTEVPDYD